MKAATGLASAASLAVVVDAVGTVGWLNAGTGTEGNPVVAWTMALLGIVPALVAWAALRIGVLFLMTRLPRCLPVLAVLTLWSWWAAAYGLDLVGRPW